MNPSSEGKFNIDVGAVIENPLGNILLIRRAFRAEYNPGMWEIVTGRLKQGESPEEGLQREVLEEVGIEELEIIKPLSVKHLYRGEKNVENDFILIVYKCRSQSDQVKLSFEHEDYIWLPPYEALKKVESEGVRSDIQKFIDS